MSVDQDTGAPTKLSDELKHAKFSSLAWTHDHKGFFYHRYPAPDAKDLGTEVDSNQNKQMWCVGGAVLRWMCGEKGGGCGVRGADKGVGGCLCSACCVQRCATCMRTYSWQCGEEQHAVCVRAPHKTPPTPISSLHHSDLKTRAPAPLSAPRYHAVGRPQSEDVFLWDVPEHPTWHLGAEVTDDGNVS